MWYIIHVENEKYPLHSPYLIPNRLSYIDTLIPFSTVDEKNNKFFDSKYLLYNIIFRSNITELKQNKKIRKPH